MTLKTSVFRALIHRESRIPFWKLSENSEIRFNEHRPSFERIVEEETREHMIEIEDPSIHRRKFFNDRTFQLLSLCFSQAHTRTRTTTQNLFRNFPSFLSFKIQTTSRLEKSFRWDRQFFPGAKIHEIFHGGGRCSPKLN